MAAIGIMIGGALVNALSFSGSSYLFHMIDKNAAATEMKRHNIAMEKLNRANIEYEKQRNDILDFVNKEIKKENEAISEFKEVDDALKLYNHMHPTQRINLMKKPQLADYYTPSSSMRNYEYLFIIGGLIFTGIIVKKYV